MIGLPPSLSGATNETVAVVVPVATADTPVGTFGTPNVVAVDTVLDPLFPMALIANTVNVYAAP